MEHLQERGLLLAFDAHAQSPAAEVALHRGDRLVFVSDGLVEACNARDEFFGDARLEQLVVASSAVTPDQFVDEIVAEVHRWVGLDTQLQDDVTLVVVDVCARTTERDELRTGA